MHATNGQNPRGLAALWPTRMLTYQKNATGTLGIRISEIYSSRQGEGRLTGQPSVFVRTSGCNLRCSFCDTPYTSWQPEGQQQNIDTIMTTIGQHNATHVVITGGEPMLPMQMTELTRQIRCQNIHITIETAGTVFRNVDCDLMSISPKMTNSIPSAGRAGEWSARHNRLRQSFKVVQRLIDSHDYQLKFVVQNEGDIDELCEYCDSLSGVENSKILLMPEGVDLQALQEKKSWLQPICESRGFTYCARMHIQWYGNTRGT